MAKRVIWSNKADRIFNKILEYFIERNGSKAYSRKLNQEIQSLVSIIAKQPFIGLKTNLKDVRVFIRGNYRIFYRIEDDKIIILLVWDNRQSQETINEDLLIP